MKLENQVVSLELSKKLKELGVKQESLFRWQGYLQPKEIKTCELVPSDEPIYEPYDIYSAFTVAELGELIPSNFSGLYCKYQWGFLHNRHYAYLNKMEDNSEVMNFEAETEADARAKMLIYILENNLIK